MSKFDRGIFIFIGLGIWAFAITQVLNLVTSSCVLLNMVKMLMPYHVAG